MIKKFLMIPITKLKLNFFVAKFVVVIKSKIEKFNKKIMLSIMLLLLSVGCVAAENTKALLQQKSTLRAAWDLSNNYRYGLTVKKDPFKALAWQYVYVTILPRSYPGSYSLLEPYKLELEKNKYDEAYEYSKWLKRQYDLPARMDEVGLLSAFQAKTKELTKLNSEPKLFQHFDDFIKAVEEKDPKLAVRYKNYYHTLTEETHSEQIVYGQLQFNGAHLEQAAVRNQALFIDKHGFFLGSVLSPLYLTAKGYQSFIKYFTSPSQPVSLGRIALSRLPKKQLGSIVGRIEPLSKLKNIGLALRFKEQYTNQDDPWYSPTIPVTTLPNGQFYIKGLAPAAYELLVVYQDKKQVFEVNLASNNVKTLKTITIN